MKGTPGDARARGAPIVGLVRWKAMQSAHGDGVGRSARLPIRPVDEEDGDVKTPLCSLVVGLAALALCLSACRGPTPVESNTPSSESEYVFVLLKTGPKSSEHTEAERNEIFRGHMANMKRLADAKQLIVAGPFGQGGHDAADRGLFVFDVPTLEAAQALVATDPGVQSGEFRPVLWPMRSSSTLHQTLDLEAKALQGREWTMKDGRVYELVTVKDMHAAEPVLVDLEAKGKVIWSGSFGGDAAGWGVIVLDASTAQEAASILGPGLKSMGECWIDPWFATKSLEGLRALRRPA
jgi:uncharacterized protein YciI